MCGTFPTSQHCATQYKHRHTQIWFKLFFIFKRKLPTTVQRKLLLTLLSLLVLMYGFVCVCVCDDVVVIVGAVVVNWMESIKIVKAILRFWTLFKCVNTHIRTYINCFPKMSGTWECKPPKYRPKFVSVSYEICVSLIIAFVSLILAVCRVLKVEGISYQQMFMVMLLMLMFSFFFFIYFHRFVSFFRALLFGVCLLAISFYLFIHLWKLTDIDKMDGCWPTPKAGNFFASVVFHVGVSDKLNSVLLPLLMVMMKIVTQSVIVNDVDFNKIRSSLRNGSRRRP